MPQLEHIEAIEKCLWSAADNLRANSNYATFGIITIRFRCRPGAVGND
jgi:hypothetical protein